MLAEWLSGAGEQAGRMPRLAPPKTLLFRVCIGATWTLGWWCSCFISTQGFALEALQVTEMWMSLWSFGILRACDMLAGSFLDFWINLVKLIYFAVLTAAALVLFSGCNI